MLREIDFAKVSDGKFYQLGDMVKADCQGCAGCSECCRGMGTSIVLDPLDVHRISSGLGNATMMEKAFSIFCRSMNVRSQTRQKSRSANGSTLRTSNGTTPTSVTGTII